MALSLERIIWYDFNDFLHVEISVEEPFFFHQIAGNERWEVVERMSGNILRNTDSCWPDQNHNYIHTYSLKFQTLCKPKSLGPS